MEETLGELHDRGEISPDLVTSLERVHGAGWRDLTPQDAITANAASLADIDQQLAANENRRNYEAGIRRLAESLAADPRLVLDDDMIRRMIHVVYGDAPTQEQIDHVLDHVADIRSHLGES